MPNIYNKASRSYAFFANRKHPQGARNLSYAIDA